MRAWLLAVLAACSVAAASADEAATYCWGPESEKLGIGATSPHYTNQTYYSTPVEVTGAPPFVALSVGQLHACGLTATGDAWCWGDNNDGELGSGRTAISPVPVKVVGAYAFTAISAGDQITCALDAAGAAYCFGGNEKGQLGDGTHEPASAPVPVTGNLTFRAIAAGLYTACGVANDGTAYCWGESPLDMNNSTYGPEPHDRLAPERVFGNHNFTSITVSRNNQAACAVDTDGAAWCWGTNRSGQLGSGVTDKESMSPVKVAGGHNFTSVSAGTAHTCGVDVEGRAWCWGRRDHGELGDGRSGIDEDALVPVQVLSDKTFRSIRAGHRETCAVDTEGAGWCWGDGAEGVLGNGKLNDSVVPVQVTGGHHWFSIGTGETFACGLAAAA